MLFGCECRYREVIKTPLYYKDHPDEHIIELRSVCVHVKHIVKGKGSLIFNPLVCFDCELREEQ